MLRAPVRLMKPHIAATLAQHTAPAVHAVLLASHRARGGSAAAPQSLIIARRDIVDFSRALPRTHVRASGTQQLELRSLCIDACVVPPTAAPFNMSVTLCVCTHESVARNKRHGNQQRVYV